MILLSILILLTLWSVLSQHIHQPAASAAESEPASSEVMVPQNLVPNFIGMDYTQVQNNREYTSMYLFYVTEEYSDTAPGGPDHPAAAERGHGAQGRGDHSSGGQQRPTDGRDAQYHRLYAGWRGKGTGSEGPCGQLLYGGERRLLCRRMRGAYQARSRAPRWKWAR